MLIELPADAPKTTAEAFAWLGKLANGATVDDLKILALIEAIGLKLYEEIASRVLCQRRRISGGWRADDQECVSADL